VRALLRRARAPRQGRPVEDEQLISGALVLDVPRRNVSLANTLVQLTYVEFEILRALMTHPGRVYSRRMLLEALWGSSDFRDPRTIDVHVRHLREKLEPDSSRPEYILTVRSVGYRFREA
jgi:DNA-binding response OmpR family regulator